MRRLIFIDDDKTERDAFLRIAGGKYDCALQSVWTHDELLSGAAGLDSHHHLPVGAGYPKIRRPPHAFYLSRNEPATKVTGVTGILQVLFAADHLVLPTTRS